MARKLLNVQKEKKTARREAGRRGQFIIVDWGREKFSNDVENKQTGGATMSDDKFA